MESFGGVGILPGGCIARKKRSNVAYKPRVGPQKYIFPPFGQLFGKGSPDKNQNNETKVVLSDGQGGENKPKKFKLKLGGVTRTIHTNYKMKPLSQDDVDGSRLCSNEGKGFGVERNKHSKINYSSQKDHSSRGKVLRQSAPRNNEQVNSKVAANRCVLDPGFREYKPPRLGKESRKKSRSEKAYEDSDYSEEEDEEDEEVISDDEPESNGKKLKRRSVTLLQERQKDLTPTTRNQSLQSGRDILTGSASGFLDLENNLLPAPSKRKKGKISEVEQQLKKVEATERRKMQLQKAARKAEDDAIRKILGQGSRKKKEEKLKQQRDELIQGKTGSSVALAPNSVRWVIGPNGTIVTFSDDIGLPDIFTPVPCSYPPSREKCAGPNCTNAYKYRDSKSKLPLCSLHCYRAIHGKIELLFAC